MVDDPSEPNVARVTLGYVQHEGRRVPQLRIQKQTLEGLESLVVTRFDEKLWDSEWECQHPGIAPKSPQMLILYEMDRVVKSIQRACTGSEDLRMQELLSFCGPLLFYAHQRISERGN